MDARRALRGWAHLSIHGMSVFLDLTPLPHRKAFVCLIFGTRRGSSQHRPGKIDFVWLWVFSYQSFSVGGVDVLEIHFYPSTETVLGCLTLDWEDPASGSRF